MDDRAAFRVLDAAFRQAIDSTDRDHPQHDRGVGALVKRVQRGTVKLHAHWLMIARNLFDRGAPLHRVEAPAHAYLAIVRSWYRKDDEGASPEALWRLVGRETAAQGAADVEQHDLANPTMKDLAEAEDKLARHMVEMDALLQAIRQQLYRA